MNRFYRYCISASLAVSGLCAQAQQGAPLQLQASDLDGARFQPSQVLGKVSLVFYWSTACAVCRDSLPELRANLQGWRNKPFVLMTVNVDPRAEDWRAYERIAAQTLTQSPGMLSLRQDAGLAVPGKLPLTLLVDSRGKVVARFEGRIAPEAWDGVADLLP